MCEHEGCDQGCTLWSVYDWAADKMIEMHLCEVHAVEAGFCPECGWYMAGCHDDHLARVGVCYDCWAEMEDEAAEWAENE